MLGPHDCTIDHNQASKQRTAIAVILLLTAHFILCASSIMHKSNTFDERAHITSGYAYWTRGDYRYGADNGILPKRWAALPLLSMDLEFPRIEPDNAQWNPYRAFFFELGNGLDRMLLHSRVMMIFMSLFFGLVVYAWSSCLFGRAGGLISLAMYCFSPTIIAHGRLVTSDLAGALFCLLSLGAVWRALNTQRLRAWMLAGLLFGCLMVSKMTWVTMGPVMLVLAVFSFRSRDGRREKARAFKKMAAGAAVAAMLAISLVWLFYGFRFAAAPLNAPPWPGPVCQIPPVQSLANTLIDCGKEFHVLPEGYLIGLNDAFSGLRHRDNFMNGNYSIVGWWSFFPFCFAVKTAIPVLALMILGAWALQRNYSPGRLHKILPLIVFISIYFGLAMASSMNIGHRHILPVYPALFILSGACALLFKTGKAARGGLAAIVLILAVQAAVIWPNYLSHFHAFSGGPAQGYRRLVDSSLDWGQDLPALAEWLKINNPRNQPVYLSYFGTSEPVHYGIKARTLPPKNLMEPYAAPLQPGVYCISATHLQQLYTGVLGAWSQPFENKYQNLLSVIRTALMAGRTPDWKVLVKFKRARFARLCHVLKQREPDAMAGYSICIYWVGQEELDRALHGPMARLPEARRIKGAGAATLCGK